MIGVASTAPNCPGLVIVNVPPWTSSGLEPLGPGSLGEVGDRGGEPLEAEPLRLVDHGHDQPVLEGDRDPEVDVVVVDDLLAVDRRVERRMMLERLDRGRGDEREVGERDAALRHHSA